MSNSNSSVMEPPEGERLEDPQPSNLISEETETTEARVPEEMIPILARLRRRFLDTYHHRPSCLWVSVNGIPVASLDIFNKRNGVIISTKVAEPFSFIEVFSEQQVRLAMLNADTGPGNPVETEAKISLSDAREIELSYAEQDDELLIRLGYTDPEIEGWERLASLGLIEPPATQDNA